MDNSSTVATTVEPQSVDQCVNRATYRVVYRERIFVVLCGHMRFYELCITHTKDNDGRCPICGAE